MLEGPHPDRNKYRIYFLDQNVKVVDGNTITEEIWAVTLKDRIRGNFGKLMIKNLEGLSGVDLVCSIFHYPEEEFDRLFAKEGAISHKLPQLFITFCEKQQGEMQPLLRTQKKGHRHMIAGLTGVSYEHVSIGLGAYISIMNDATRRASFESLRRASNGKNWLSSALLYLRSRRESFIEYILESENPVRESDDHPNNLS